jgi:hypothetical protein
MRIGYPVLITLMAVALPAYAADEQKLEPVPDAAPVIDTKPPTVIKGDEGGQPSAEELEPEVTIREGGEGQTIQEYRIRGKLYMVKITPKNAPSYYLVDQDGDGLFEDRVPGGTTRISVPQWVIAEW